MIAASLSIRAVLIFVFVIVAQVAALSMLPKTEGFRNLGWVLAALGAMDISLFALATLLRDGAPLSLLMPIMAAVMPFALIMVGLFVYGETASLLKIALLTMACVAVGVASAVK